MPQGAIAGDFSIEDDLDRLGMRAVVAVGRVGHVAPAISDAGGDDTRQLPWLVRTRHAPAKRKADLRCGRRRWGMRQVGHPVQRCQAANFRLAVVFGSRPEFATQTGLLIIQQEIGWYSVVPA
jgi:hypothetical protein